MRGEKEVGLSKTEVMHTWARVEFGAPIWNGEEDDTFFWNGEVEDTFFWNGDVLFLVYVPEKEYA